MLHEIPALAPFDFFIKEFSLSYGKKVEKKALYRLPETGELLCEEKRDALYLSWHEEGLSGILVTKYPFKNAFWPKYHDGDALELFIDTRDIKDIGVVHKYCHHFVFLPVEVEGIQAQEITKFRADDAHPLADPSSLHVSSTFQKRHYELYFKIEREALYGFDPARFLRIGFNYRIHHFQEDPQHFALSSDQYRIEKYPSLFATLHLKE